MFDQSKNALEISRKDFDRPIFLASRELFDALEPLAQKRLHQMCFFGSWSDKVSREIYLLLPAGKVPDVETVSGNLALSCRSPQRKRIISKITLPLGPQAGSPERLETVGTLPDQGLRSLFSLISPNLSWTP